MQIQVNRGSSPFITFPNFRVFPVWVKKSGNTPLYYIHIMFLYLYSTFIKVRDKISKAEKKHVILFLLFASIILNFILLYSLLILKQQYEALLPLIEEQTKLIKGLLEIPLTLSLEDIKKK